MRTTATITLILSLLSLSALAQQTPVVNGKTPPDGLSVGDPERRFDAGSAKDLWLAVHFLPTIGASEAHAFIQEYTQKASTVAGVRHVFVSTEPVEGFRSALAALHGGDKLPVYRDADGQLATRLSVPIPLAAPVLVVLDPARHELFRRTGRSSSDCIPFTDFATQMAEATQDKEAREANVASRLAIDGYDPVAYLDDRKAVPGDKKLESSFRGITYRFASEASRGRFNTDPVRYLPAYGGWCATAMAKGDKVEIDPKNFKVTNGRVFLFYKGFFGNALNDWNKDEPGLTAKADANWKKLAKQG